jgi:hypothetical protein
MLMLLEKNPKFRISAEEALSDPWITGEARADGDIATPGASRKPSIPSAARPKYSRRKKTAHGSGGKDHTNAATMSMTGTTTTANSETGPQSVFDERVTPSDGHATFSSWLYRSSRGDKHERPTMGERPTLERPAMEGGEERLSNFSFKSAFSDYRFSVNMFDERDTHNAVPSTARSSRPSNVNNMCDDRDTLNGVFSDEERETLRSGVGESFHIDRAALLDRSTNGTRIQRFFQSDASSRCAHVDRESLDSATSAPSGKGRRNDRLSCDVCHSENSSRSARHPDRNFFRQISTPTHRIRSEWPDRESINSARDSPTVKRQIEERPCQDDDCGRRTIRQSKQILEVPDVEIVLPRRIPARKEDPLTSGSSSNERPSEQSTSPKEPQSKASGRKESLLGFSRRFLRSTGSSSK